MKRALVRSVLLAWVCLGWVAAHGEQLAPRDIWPQATAAVDSGDVKTGYRKASELVDTGKIWGIKTFPLYAEAAASLARRAAQQGNKPVAEWGTKVAAQLDPRSPGVAFIRAESAADQRNWGATLTTSFAGYRNTFYNYRSRLLTRADSLVVLILAVAATALVFAIALFARYGKTMAHDFREILSAHIRGGSVTVLAFALLLLPIFLWLSPLWLIFYW